MEPGLFAVLPFQTNTYLTLQNTKYQLDSNTFKQKFNPKLNCKSNFKS